MAKNLLIVIGLSGAGKDEVQLWLEATRGILKGHPIRPLKSYLEKVYRIPEGGLDDTAWKSYIPDGSKVTMQKLMQELYFLWKRTDPLHSTRSLEEFLRSNSDKDISLASMRNLPELDLILKLSLEGLFDLHVVNISREQTVRPDVDADEDIPEIVEGLKAHCEEGNLPFYNLENNYETLSELQEALERLYYFLPVRKEEECTSCRKS